VAEYVLLGIVREAAEKNGRSEGYLKKESDRQHGKWSRRNARDVKARRGMLRRDVQGGTKYERSRQRYGETSRGNRSV
jgi:hypothetical protein